MLNTKPLHDIFHGSCSAWLNAYRLPVTTFGAGQIRSTKDARWLIPVLIIVPDKEVYIL